MNDHLIIRLATRRDAEAIALESMAEIEHNFEWTWHPQSVAGVVRFRVEARLINAGARAFYRKHGYVESEIVPAMYRNDEDEVRFEKVVVATMKEA